MPYWKESDSFSLTISSKEKIRLNFFLRNIFKTHIVHLLNIVAALLLSIYILTDNFYLAVSKKTSNKQPIVFIVQVVLRFGSKDAYWLCTFIGINKNLCKSANELTCEIIELSSSLYVSLNYFESKWKMGSSWYQINLVLAKGCNKWISLMYSYGWYVYLMSIMHGENVTTERENCSLLLCSFADITQKVCLFWLLII